MPEIVRERQAGGRSLLRRHGYKTWRLERIFLLAPAAAQSIESDVPEQTSHHESANYQDEKDRLSIKIGLALLTGNTQTFLVRLQWIC